MKTVGVLVVVLCLVGLAQLVGAQPAPVEATGQDDCWDVNGSEIPCSGTGQDGEHQAGVPWPAPRFTDSGDGTVIDNLTGLTWLKDANCIVYVMTWQQAMDWVSDLNTTSIECTDYTSMTFTDWRLPNIKELLSVLDPLGHLPSEHPFVNAPYREPWSSTSGRGPWLVWGIWGAGPKTGLHDVWAVRGGTSGMIIFNDGFESGDTSAWTRISFKSYGDSIFFKGVLL